MQYLNLGDGSVKVGQGYHDITALIQGCGVEENGNDVDPVNEEGREFHVL